MFEVKQLCGQLCLGKQGENLARIVYFEEPDLWKAKFGEGKCELLHQRNGDIAPYPVLLETEDGKVCWKITNADTAIVGEGKCELYYSVDGVIVKSKIWMTNVFPSLGENLVDPPEPYQAWVDAVLEAASKIDTASGGGGTPGKQPIIGENKNWYIWDSESERYVDSGVCAEGKDGSDGSDGKDGYTPVKGKDYWTESDKTEIVGEVVGAIDIASLSNRVDDVEKQVQGKASQSDLEAFANDLNDRKADKTTVEDLKTDIETALDNIIAIENNYIGGDDV